jgi:hypothetical protein
MTLRVVEVRDFIVDEFRAAHFFHRRTDTGLMLDRRWRW